MIRASAVMGTIVTIHVVDRPGVDQQAAVREESIERALAWFRAVEQQCSRFNRDSEVMRLTAHIGVAMPASEMLFEAVRFALAVADESGGAFDPTVGGTIEALGFNREHRTGEIIDSALDRAAAVSYRDVRLDARRRTITLLRPLVLDLGAVAKGLAIDMAVRELQPLKDFAIDAGGDLYVGGQSPSGTPWSVGIRHPRRDHELIDTLSLSDVAVCTSGDYERRIADPEGGRHHIVDARTGEAADGVASVTVVAPTAMAADALATAAFVLGPAEGIRLLERQAVDGFMLSPALERYSTRGMARACVRGG
jgi:thiamine biosynthesis lipoprotein